MPPFAPDETNSPFAAYGSTERLKKKPVIPTNLGGNPSASNGLPNGFQVIALDDLNTKKVQEIFDQITKSWKIEVAPLIDKPTFKDQFKSDLTNAAYRVGSKQLLNATKTFLVQYVRKTCSEEGKVRALIDLLDTEIGLSIMAMFIGMSVSQIPQLANSPKMNRILKEFRVSGLTTVGNSAIEAIMKSLLPVVSSALQEIEKSQTISVEEPTPLLEEELLAISENETITPLQRQS